MKKYEVEVVDITQTEKVNYQKAFKADYIFERTITGSYKLIKNRDGDVPSFVYITRTQKG